jgi:hypothetical protein
MVPFGEAKEMEREVNSRNLTRLLLLRSILLWGGLTLLLAGGCDVAEDNQEDVKAGVRFAADIGISRGEPSDAGGSETHYVPNLRCMVKTDYFLDWDGDGVPRVPNNPGDRIALCPGQAVPADYALPNGSIWDCNDESPAIHPFAEELCDQIDNNCDGQVDEDIGVIYYYDFDGDGYGGPVSLTSCTEPHGYVTNKFDCDDHNSLINAGATEICDGLDNDCDGEVDEDWGIGMACYLYFEECISKGVAYCSTESSAACDAPEIVPTEEICDGLDNDCNGNVDEGLYQSFYEDSDGDGVGNGAISMWACSVPPGFSPLDGDCDDSDVTIYDGAVELCDGIDNDCDGSSDLDWECCPIGLIADVEDCGPTDFIFVIDNSGSMEDSDPWDLRYQGLLGFVDNEGQYQEGFVDKMSAEDRGLVVPFADSSTVIGTFESDPQILKANVQAAKWAFVGGGTAIGEALVESAIPAFEEGDAERVIILLTDGYTGDEGWYPPEDTAQMASQEDVAIYSVGLGWGIDKNYLVTVSDSRFVFAASAEEILGMYEALFAISSSGSWQECTGENGWQEVDGVCSDTCAWGFPPKLYWPVVEGDDCSLSEKLEDSQLACELPTGYIDEQCLNGEEGWWW